MPHIFGADPALLPRGGFIQVAFDRDKLFVSFKLAQVQALRKSVSNIFSLHSFSWCIDHHQIIFLNVFQVLQVSDNIC